MRELNIAELEYVGGGVWAGAGAGGYLADEAYDEVSSNNYFYYFIGVKRI